MFNAHFFAQGYVIKSKVQVCIYMYIYAAEEDFVSVAKIMYLESRIDVNISIINDESIEGNETFTIYLTSGVGVNVSPYVQTEVTIIDDEGMCNSNVYDCFSLKQ